MLLDLTEKIPKNGGVIKESSAHSFLECGYYLR